MSLKRTLEGFIDNVGLAQVFSAKRAAPTVLRAPLLKGIGNARRLFDTGKTKIPNRWWTVNNGVVAFTVKVKGNTFDINGVATNHVPEDRFPDFLDAFQQAVEAGEFDAELKNHGSGEAEVAMAEAPAKASAPVLASAPGKVSGRGTISAEAAKLRGQKAAASRKANKARLTNS